MDILETKTTCYCSVCANAEKTVQSKQGITNVFRDFKYARHCWRECHYKCM